MARLLDLDNRGAAAAEMALLTPIFVALLLGSLELGRVFYHEHKLVQAVRDSARWAARQPFTAFPACGTTLDSTDPIVVTSKQIARTGQPSGGTDRLPQWDSTTTTFELIATCSTAAGTVAYSGIYKDVTHNSVATGARIIEIRASIPYDAMFGLPGVGGAGLRLNAQQQAAVTGI